MSSRLRILFFSCVFLFLSFAVSAADSIQEKDAVIEKASSQEEVKPQKPFYSDRNRGWYSYEKNEEKKKKKKKRYEPKAVQPFPVLSDYTYDELWKMHPDQVAELTQQFLRKALQEPSEQNVYEYLTLQDLGRRKGVAFSNAATFAMLKYPQLTTADVFQSNPAGIAAYNDSIRKDVDSKLAENKEDFALILFTRTGCGFCVKGRELVVAFSERYNWPVREVNTALSEMNQALADEMNVTVTPTVIIVYRATGEAMPVANGVVSRDELKRNVYFAIRSMKGETTPSQFWQYDFLDRTGADPETLLRGGNGGYPSQVGSKRRNR